MLTKALQLFLLIVGVVIYMSSIRGLFLNFLLEVNCKRKDVHTISEKAPYVGHICECSSHLCSNLCEWNWSWMPKGLFPLYTPSVTALSVFLQLINCVWQAGEERLQQKAFFIMKLNHLNLLTKDSRPACCSNPAGLSHCSLTSCHSSIDHG